MKKIFRHDFLKFFLWYGVKRELWLKERGGSAKITAPLHLLVSRFLKLTFHGVWAVGLVKRRSLPSAKRKTYLVIALEIVMHFWLDTFCICIDPIMSISLFVWAMKTGWNAFWISQCYHHLKYLLLLLYIYDLLQAFLCLFLAYIDYVKRYSSISN